jgi:antitoxin component YwqK of YwqJK toxin-antitoxin module
MKKYFKSSLLIFLLFITACKNETCKDVVYKNGLSYKNNLLYTGTCVTHHTNGNISSIQSYLNGFDHGKWEFFFPNKIKRTEGEFFKGKKHGKWIYYYENQKVWKENFYTYGKKTGIWNVYNMDGKLTSTVKIN